MLMNSFNRLREFNRSIGVVGLAWSGKTVFLTSLIDHLRNHDPRKLHLDPIKRNFIGRQLFGQEHSVVIRKFEPLPSHTGFELFPYKKFRDTLAQERPRWPEKTKDIYEYSCKFERSDMLRGVRFHFLDFPGERLADFTMGGDYRQWSNTILTEFDSQREYRERAADFLELMDGRELHEPDAVFSYKIALARFLEAYKPLITPSTFLLDAEGRQARRKEAEDVANERLSGLAADKQFAPLSEAAAEKNPELNKLFAERYREYRKQVPDRLFRKLAKCHRLIVLVDVPGTLAANVGRYNDSLAILESLLTMCDKNRGFLKKFGMLLASLVLPEAWRPRGISRIAFVATKSDMVRYEETDRLVSLLRQMVEKQVRDYDVNHEYFACSAVTSTRPAGAELAGHLTYDVEGNLLPPRLRTEDKNSFFVSPLPKTWPDRWTEGDFTFPEVYPVMSPKKDEPPDQEGLGNILNYLMQEDYTE